MPDTPMIIYWIICGIYGLLTPYKSNQPQFWIGLSMIWGSFLCGTLTK